MKNVKNLEMLSVDLALMIGQAAADLGTLAQELAAKNTRDSLESAKVVNRVAKVINGIAVKLVKWHETP